MSDADEIAKHRAGHAERMKAAGERVEENLRRHHIAEAREAKRRALIERIEKRGGRVHDSNCCEDERVDLPEVRSDGGSINIDLSEMDHGDGSDPELLVLETIANLLEAYRS